MVHEHLDEHLDVEFSMVMVLLLLSTKALKHHNHNLFSTSRCSSRCSSRCAIHCGYRAWTFPYVYGAARALLEVSTLRLSPDDLSLQKLVGGVQKGV